MEDKKYYFIAFYIVVVALIVTVFSLCILARNSIAMGLPVFSAKNILITIAINIAIVPIALILQKRKKD